MGKILIIFLMIILLIACVSGPIVNSSIMGKQFSSWQEQRSVIEQAHSEGWIKPSMTPDEVVSLIGQPIVKDQSPRGPVWIYQWSASAPGFHMTYVIFWTEEGRVKQIKRQFKP